MNTPPASSAVRFNAHQRELLRDLFAAGCVLVGDEVQRRFGLRSPIYINMRENLYDRPELLWRVGGEFAGKICELAAPPSSLDASLLDAAALQAASVGVAPSVSVPPTPPAIPARQCVVGIPDTATPLALTTALYAWHNRLQPEITFALLRKEAKRYPNHEGSFWIGPREPQSGFRESAGPAADAGSSESPQARRESGAKNEAAAPAENAALASRQPLAPLAGDQHSEPSAASERNSQEPVAREYNLLDDVVASGLTKRAAAAKLRAEGIALTRIIVFFDRGQGDGLREEGFSLHAIFQLKEVVDFYQAESLISAEDHQRIQHFLTTRRFDRAKA